MLSFMGQGQLGKIGKLGKLATFACKKRISENLKCLPKLAERFNFKEAEQRHFLLEKFHDLSHFKPDPSLCCVQRETMSARVI